MRVLVLGNDTPVGYSISAFANPLRRHELIEVSMDGTRWARPRQVRRVVRDAAPDVVLDTRIVTQIDSSDRIGQREVQRTAWLADACEREGASYFYLSSAFVFSGKMTRPYLESDTPDVTGGLGGVLLDIENILTSRLDDVFILRLGRLFAGRRPNALCTALDTLRRSQTVQVSDRLQGNPVHVGEVARVCMGILDQMSTGADRYGVFHYCSLGETGYLDFAEAAMACASQYEPFVNARKLLQNETNDNQPVLNHTLECSKIRREFGIQQLPWRHFIDRAVTRYLELYVKAEGVIDK
jgi:dTDP-4-dehydrorhamnose reductase